MHNIKSEKGYSLFLTVLIVVLFSILAVSLLAIVMSGTSKNMIREDFTQANELSEKGFQHIVNQINYELQQNILEKGVSETQFKSLFLSVLNKYKCPSTGEEYPIIGTGDTGAYQTCIDR